MTRTSMKIPGTALCTELRGGAPEETLDLSFEQNLHFQTELTQHKIGYKMTVHDIFGEI